MALSENVRARLDEISESLIDQWQVLQGDALSQAEVAANVADMVSMVVHLAGGHSPADQDEPATPLQRKILQRLRRIAVSGAADTPPAEAVELLSAIEKTAESLEAAWSERFQDRLTGPSGLDLVVEVAHDLRSPLTSILFLAETMLRGRSGPLTSLQERQLGLVYSAAFGLNAVASDVIELVRGGDRLVGRDAQPFSITELLEAVGDIVLPIAEEKDLALSFSGPEGDKRTGHPGALNRVLLNLTTNALKFTSDGGVKVEITDVTGSRDRVKFSVTDSGRGIPEAAMPTLFEPFRRRHQDGDYAFSGSGLGLSICRKLVEAMGGNLDVETTKGAGTAFTFEIELPPAPSGAFIG